MDVYYARIHVEQQRVAQAELALGHKIDPDLNEKIGRLKLEDGKQLASAVITKINTTAVDVTGTRGPQRLTVTISYSDLISAASRAGNDYLDVKMRAKAALGQNPSIPDRPNAEAARRAMRP